MTKKKSTGGSVASPSTSPSLEIIGAAYGLANVTRKVIELMNHSTDPQSLSVVANNETFGDSWENNPKSLTVAYRYGSQGIPQVKAVKEDETLSIPLAQAGDATSVEPLDLAAPLTIFAATYGPSDETAKVRGLIDPAKQTLSVTANNDTFSDTWEGVGKSLVVVAAYEGQVPFLDIVQENNPYYLKYRPRLHILSAAYGRADVREKVQSSVSRRTLEITANNDTFGDNWEGVGKSLDVVYQYEGKAPQEAIVQENGTLSIDYDETVPAAQMPPADPTTLNVIKAIYGLGDVTQVVAGRLVGNTLNVPINNWTFPDTWEGNEKSFALTYSWGPQPPQLSLLTENSMLEVAPAVPTVPTDLLSLGGMFGNGDKIMVEAASGSFWAVGSDGKVKASAASRQAATEFTVHPLTGDSARITLSTPTGVVGLNADGTLQVTAAGSPLELVPSAATTGTMVLGIPGKGFATELNGGQIAASGYDDLLLGTSCSLFLTTTQQGLENHLRACGVDPEAEVQVSREAMKVAWDLTGGFFLALGLGPAFIKQEMSPGLYALLRTNPRVAAFLDGLWDAVMSTPGITFGIPTLIGFLNILYAEGLLWKVVRALLPTLTAWALSALVIKIISWVSKPAVAAAEVVIAFAGWAITTTLDVVAWVNAGNKQVALPALA